VLVHDYSKEGLLNGYKATYPSPFLIIDLLPINHFFPL
jgi:hypothetical protein